MIRYGAAAAAAAVLIGWSLRLDDGTTAGRTTAFLALCGAAFGALLQRSRLCFTSAFRDFFVLRDRRAALGILAALAVGSIGYAVVYGIQIPEARYLPDTAHIAPAGPVVVLGGLSFGVGMVLAGGCISGQLYRLGEGSLVAPAALLGCIPGYWLAFSLWNLFYLKSVSTAPVVWLPSKLGYAGALGLQLGAFAALGALLLWKGSSAPQPAREPLDLKGALREPWPGWAGGAAIGMLATLAYLWNHPLGVTAEIGRVSRRAGAVLGLVPARLEGLDRLAGCRAIGSDRWLTES
ncbi:MAG: YeeE/YedE family protein, partial [Planctomycetota bacterium]